VRRLTTAGSFQIEAFKVSPLSRAVIEVERKLLCSYPGPAIQIPAYIFLDECFLRELSSFLVQMDVDHLDGDESARHDYILELLVGILKAYGQPAVVDCITKRNVVTGSGKDSHGHSPWRRSPLWLVLKVSLQSSVSSTNIYKHFILFFHAHLLLICVRRDFPSELLYVMRVKMARRLTKLGPGISRDICQIVHDAANETEALLSKRWSTFQAVESTNRTTLFNALDFVRDAHISLNNSYKYLEEALGTAPHTSSRSQFIPSHTPRLCDIHDFTQFTNGRLKKAIAVDRRIVIADFELSVERNLESWAAAYRSNYDASEVIASCIQQYYAGAKDLYEANPEDNSIMILTIMDLWVALDRITIHQCPLLKEYSPEIPSDFLHCILLHRSSDLKRALNIEEYLSRRHKEALGIPSVFSNSLDDSCFAVKYFCASQELQHLNDRITTRIRRARLYEKLRSPLRDAEWCLLLDAPTQVVAFELSLPRAFSAWRDITYMVLCDIGLNVPNFQNSSVRTLHDFRILHSLVAERQGHPRVTVVLRPGSFELFDCFHRSFAVTSFSGSSPAKLCTPPIPESSPYSSLHRFVSGTQHAPNAIIAAQAHCPEEMNLHEFLAFSGLRCGPRLQWFNIARELASPSLSFRCEEVHTLITHAAWQLGPLSNGAREWHVDLDVSNFGDALLRGLGSLLRTIQANWQEEITVRTIGT
jgi:hypothetical protein